MEAYIGGLFALGGVLVGYLGQALINWREINERKQKLLREKYEEFSNEILAARLEFSELFRLTVADFHNKSWRAEHATRARSIALIYFPELRPSAKRYKDSIESVGFYVECNCDRTDGERVAVHALPHDDEESSTFSELNQSAARNYEELLGAIEEHAAKFTKA